NQCDQAATSGPREKERCVASQGRPGTVTMIFRGLMVFHLDRERNLYEVGTLSVPEHELRISIKKSSLSGQTIYTIPVGPFIRRPQYRVGARIGARSGYGGHCA